MSQQDEVAGVIGEIEADTSAHDPIDQNETISEPIAEGAESESTTQKEETEQQETGQSDEGQTQQTETSDAHSKTNTETKDSKTESETKTKESDFANWRDTLPPPPSDYLGKKPEVDENGQITNMTPEEYIQYVTEEAKTASRQETYNTSVEHKALEIAEEILPDIKTNALIRQMVENTRIASILNGNTIDTVQAAVQVREALGISPQKIQAAKAEGANQTKASITVQKNAALETGSAQHSDPDKVGDLQKRIKRGDDEAFVELLGVWEKDGKLNKS